MITASDLWAVRYPSTHELYVLERPAGGTGTERDLDARSSRIRARSAHLATSASVLVATERMDDDPGWRLLDAGELVHVGADLRIDTSSPFPPALGHPLDLAQLDAVAAASQHPSSPLRGERPGESRQA